jgi:CPA1 family monovalent cation:H+ antiporter
MIETTHISSISNSVIMLLILLLVASLSMPMLKRIRFPHSVFLVLAGLGIGIIADWIYAHSNVQWISEISGSLAGFQLSTDAILFIFLPTLIFESSYKINSRELIKDLPYILILAVPAFLISVFTVGFMLHYITGLDLQISLLFGALISATDPVAVIAIFKELGAPKRLTMLVEGESLSNDAAAIVIFAIFYGFITSVDNLPLGQNVAIGIGQFIVIFLGGIFIGLISGYIFSNIIGTIKTNPPVEILLTTMLAYLSFVIAHHYFHVSGVMSTVSAGLLLGSYGRTKISLEVHKFMGNFWETMSFSANAILFLSIGLLLPHHLSTSTLIDYLPLLIISIIAINAGRAVSIFTLLPFLSSLGFVEKISRKFMAVLWWGGGLRGAIAIALALSLIGSKLSPSYQQTILLLTFGVVMFTLLVNALSARGMIRWLGIDRLGKDELYSQKMGLLHNKIMAHQKMVSLSEKARYYPNIYLKLIDEYKKQEEQLQDELADLSEMSEDEKHDVLVREAFMVEKNFYFESFARGELSEISLRELQGEVDKELDRLKAGQLLFHERHQFERKSWVENCIKPFKKFLPRYTTHTLSMRYEKAKATINVVRKIMIFLNQKEKEHKKLESLCKDLQSSYISLNKDAEEEIAEIILNFPEYVNTVVEIVLRTFSLNTEQNYLNQMYQTGQLQENVYNQIKEQIEKQLSELKRKPIEKITIEPVKLLKQVSFLGYLDDTHIQKLSKYLHTKPFLKKDHLIKAGSRGDEMFIITRGVVRVYRGDLRDPEILATLKSGDILGEMALISKKPRNASAIALSHGSALVLDKNIFQDFLDENPGVKEKIYEIYHERE